MGYTAMCSGSSTNAGSSETVVRKATVEDVQVVKRIADKNRDTLGFVLRPALIDDFKRDWGIVALVKCEIVGFIHYRHRRDSQTTVYQICVEETWRQRGIGKVLIDAVEQEAMDIGKSRILLKCPENNRTANAFYNTIGFRYKDIEPGKAQRLVLWEKTLPARARKTECTSLPQ